VIVEELKTLGRSERKHPTKERQIYAVIGIVRHWCGEIVLRFVAQDTILFCHDQQKTARRSASAIVRFYP